MHEAAITSGLMRLLLEQAAKHAVTRVTRVTVRIGRLKAVEPRSLAACFEMFAEGTLAEGAELVIESVPITGRCQSCGVLFEVEKYVFRCLECQGSDIAILSGEELYMDSFETG